MKDNEKNNQQLLSELKSLRKKLAELESIKKDQEYIERELQSSNEVLEMITRLNLLKNNKRVVMLYNTNPIENSD